MFQLSSNIIFSRQLDLTLNLSFGVIWKKLKVIHPNLTFTGKDVHFSQFQKHLGLVLDSKLNFDMYFKKNSIINNGDCMFLSCLIMSRTRFRVNPHSHLPECQGTPCSKQARNRKIK